MPQWGLLPAASAHDWLSGSVIFNDAWCIAGMAEAVRLLEKSAIPATPRLAKELQDYRACLECPLQRGPRSGPPRPLGRWHDDPLRAADGHRVRLGRRRLDLRRLWSASGRRIGRLGSARPAGRSNARLPRSRRPAGLARFSSQHGTVRQPAECFWQHYVEPETHWPMYDVFLNRDDLPRFFELLFNNLVAAVHADFRVGCEGREGVVSVSPADAEHWRMVRDMFVREDAAATTALRTRALPVAGDPALVAPPRRASGRKRDRHALRRQGQHRPANGRGWKLGRRRCPIGEFGGKTEGNPHSSPLRRRPPIGLRHASTANRRQCSPATS